MSREAHAKTHAQAVTDAAAAFRLKGSGGRETVRETREIVTLDPSALAVMERRVSALERALAERPAPPPIPLTPIAVPVPVPVLEAHAARLDALEDHASAAGGLVDALQVVMRLAQDQDARTAKLEDEARATHETIQSVMPALGAVIALRQAS